ncbi:hypothetical protein N7541_002486 [Penicillium brevicompactum]|uniref:Uncharacterized protein n=1 Tax=Penicillium brevicompactum TaxID=5074 RepID=A0A9W9UR36_PENBR|nr:hypothetical protein N7452_000660 [Penicillium brevicompactum]KAJ5361642.1 hypothetical protein N7541_002486 [Penicillium brevicompactum]
MGYIRNASPNRNGHRKSQTIKVGQLTGGADANGGAVRTMPMSQDSLLPRVLDSHGMPGTNTRYFRRDVKASFLQPMMNGMQAKRHTAWCRPRSYLAH